MSLQYQIFIGEELQREADAYLPYPVGGVAGIEWIVLERDREGNLIFDKDGKEIVKEHNVVIGAPILIQNLDPEVDPEVFKQEMMIARHIVEEIRKRRNQAWAEENANSLQNKNAPEVG